PSLDTGPKRKVPCCKTKDDAAPRPECNRQAFLTPRLARFSSSSLLAALTINSVHSVHHAKTPFRPQCPPCPYRRQGCKPAQFPTKPSKASAGAGRGGE